MQLIDTKSVYTACLILINTLDFSENIRDIKVLFLQDCTVSGGAHFDKKKLDLR